MNFLKKLLFFTPVVLLSFADPIYTKDQFISDLESSEESKKNRVLSYVIRNHQSYTWGFQDLKKIYSIKCLTANRDLSMQIQKLLTAADFKLKDEPLIEVIKFCYNLIDEGDWAIAELIFKSIPLSEIKLSDSDIEKVSKLIVDSSRISGDLLERKTQILDKIVEPKRLYILTSRIRVEIAYKSSDNYDLLTRPYDIVLFLNGNFHSAQKEKIQDLNNVFDTDRYKMQDRLISNDVYIRYIGFDLIERFVKIKDSKNLNESSKKRLRTILKRCNFIELPKSSWANAAIKTLNTDDKCAGILANELIFNDKIYNDIERFIVDTNSKKESRDFLAFCLLENLPSYSLEIQVKILNIFIKKECSLDLNGMEVMMVSFYNLKTEFISSPILMETREKFLVILQDLFINKWSKYEMNQKREIVDILSVINADKKLLKLCILEIEKINSKNTKSEEEEDFINLFSKLNKIKK